MICRGCNGYALTRPYLRIRNSFYLIEDRHTNLSPYTLQPCAIQGATALMDSSRNLHSESSEKPPPTQISSSLTAYGTSPKEAGRSTDGTSTSLLTKRLRHAATEHGKRPRAGGIGLRIGAAFLMLDALHPTDARSNATVALLDAMQKRREDGLRTRLWLPLRINTHLKQRARKTAKIEFEGEAK